MKVITEMPNLPEPEQKISSKAVPLWRLEAFLFYTISILLTSTGQLLAYFFNWHYWLKTMLYILLAYLLFRAMIDIIFKPVYLERTWRYEIKADFIQLKSGFLSMQQTIIPTDRIEYVTLQQGPLLHTFSLATITIGTAASKHTIPALSEDVAQKLRDEIAHITKIHHDAIMEIQATSNDETALTKQMLFPFIRKERAFTLFNQFRPMDPWPKNWCSVTKEALFLHLIAPSYLLVIIVFFVFYFSPEYWFIPLLYGVLLISVRVLKTIQTKYAYNSEQIYLQHGFVTSRFLVTTWQQIAELTVLQNYLEKRLNVTTVVITLREKPTYVTMVEHIPIEAAVNMYSYYKNASA